ncbi:magnesium transporter MgtE [Zobellella denitrificans]|uniref:Magnesium transporter MgtE n=1 Tax=Zobellella denitrificans TaxID=347534 RepID=A0A291HP75_9GAMM|nr:magnesium transporter [Zobellella denitrificans]ATG73871.1 magnesium transporter MgtE [Zobellella denitrificans]
MPRDLQSLGEPVVFETAAEHVCTDVPVFAPDCRAAEARQGLTERRYECASHVVVCRDGRLCGMVRIEDLLPAPNHVTLATLMEQDPPVVAPGVDQEVVAWRAVRHAESALGMVDGEGRFVGLIPPYRMLAVLLAEHEEDLTRLGGFTKSTEAARSSSEEPVPRRFRHRLPWLLVGLLGALVAADLVGWFESQLQRTLMLAFFIPGLVYLADAVGTQTETVVVRGLSVGVAMRTMVRRELLAGLAIGLVLALVAGPLVWLRWSDPTVALCVGLAVLAACSTATITAMGLPWLLYRAGMDPAFGSGPLATVIQDLSTILIYFAIVTAVIG